MMDLNKINKLTSIYKESQVRRRIIPDWAKRHNIQEPKEKFPGFLADIDEDPTFDDTSNTAPAESNEMISDDEAVFTQGKKSPKVSKTINEKLKDALYGKLLISEIFDSANEARRAAEQYGPDAKTLQLDYMTQAWAPKISKWVVIDHNQNIHEVKTAYVSLLSRIYSRIQNRKTKEQDRKDLEQYTKQYWEHANKEPVNTGYKQKVLQYDPDESGTYHVDKPNTRIPEVPAHKGDNYMAFERMYVEPEEARRDENKQIMRNIRETTEDELFGGGEERLNAISEKVKDISRELRSLLVDTKPYESLGRDNNPSARIRNKLDKLIANGEDAQMIKVQLPKTPYGEELTVWYLAKPNADRMHVAELLIELQKLRANKANIENSLKDRSNRLANLNKFMAMIKTAEDAAEPEKKSAFEAMEESMLNEAKSKATPLDRLVQMTRLKRKFSVPAMMNFIEIAEKTQEPQFDYARDILNGRIPKFKEFGDEYKALVKVLSPMSEEDMIADRAYNTVSRLFTLWNIVLAKFNRNMAYDPLPVLRNKKPPKTDAFKQDEAPSILNHPAGAYSRNISHPSK